MDLWTLAEEVASSYAHNSKVSAIIVAGSVGRGRSDEFSDLEIDVYWASPPTDQDRLDAISRAGGSLTTLWDYEPDEAEWSEDFTIEGIPITISNFTTSLLDDVLADQDSSKLLDHLRLSAIHQGRVVTGHDLVKSWIERSPYTDQVQNSALNHFLWCVPADRWRHVPALAARGDLLMLRLVCVDMLETLIGLWFALNRTYVEHPRFKWANRVVTSFERLPPDAAERLRQACLAEPIAACDIVQSLILETLDLVDSHVPALGTSDLRQSLAASRI